LKALFVSAGIKAIQHQIIVQIVDEKCRAERRRNDA
jgi:hypothetical protein